MTPVHKEIRPESFWLDSQCVDNRRNLVEGIIEATRPECTGRFSFDGASWQGHVLRLDGQHLTPSFELRMVTGGVHAKVVGKDYERSIPIPWFSAGWIEEGFRLAGRILARKLLLWYRDMPEFHHDERAFRAWDR